MKGIVMNNCNKFIWPKFTNLFSPNNCFKAFIINLCTSYKKKFFTCFSFVSFNISFNGCFKLNSHVAKGPGLFWVLPCTDSIQIVDLRTVTFDVPPQEILTKDSVTVAVDAVCYFRTFNPVVSITQAENATYSTRLLAVIFKIYSF